MVCGRAGSEAGRGCSSNPITIRFFLQHSTLALVRWKFCNFASFVIGVRDMYN